MDRAFGECSNLSGSAIDNPDLQKVTNMSFMFYNATSFNGDISSWNVSNVTNMIYMFGKASSFNRDISNWNVSNVTHSTSMFYRASSMKDEFKPTFSQ